MRRTIFFVFLFSVISLIAQFTDPVQINEDLDNIFYRGSDACKVIGNNVYMVFVEDSLAANLWFSQSEDGVLFTQVLIDDGLCLDKQALPTLEIMPSGKIIIFYMKEADNVNTLHKAASDDNGVNFEIEEIETDVNQFASSQEEGELVLAYKKHNFVNMSYFQHFTQIEETENSSQQPDVLRFTGMDVLEGPVHSNDNIWIHHIIGGWPTFHCKVTTSQRIMDAATGLPAVNTAPMDQIFLGGWEEEIQPVVFPPDAATLQNVATPVGTGYDIVYMKVNGNSIETMFGDIQSPGVQEFPVYSWFPHNAAAANSIVNAGGNWFEESDLVWTNQLTLYDTVWTAGPTLPVSLQGSAYYLPDSELWIEGEVNGILTVGCANNVYITGDITYANTPVGTPPDDPDNLNTTDYFGLISEEKILIRYKHRDPFDNFVLRDDNCYNVNLYGAYAALGEGDSLQYGNLACHYDGTFTFEYQHPHGSTPDFAAMSPYTLQDTIYSHIDLHKFIFPIDFNLPPEIQGFNLHGNNPVSPLSTCGFPYEGPDYLNSYPNNDPQNYVYPYGTDYPWYNPVWPESSTDIVFERGILHVWGSIAQRRCGFIHRSGSDPYNHPPGNNEWDLDNFHFDGIHPPTGYAKDYHYDSRFMEMQPDFFLNTAGGYYHSAKILYSNDEGSNFAQLAGRVLRESENICYLQISDDLMTLITTESAKVKIDFSFDSGSTFFSHYEYLDGTLQAAALSEGKVYLLYKDDTADQNKVYEFDPLTDQITIYQQFSHSQGISDFAIAASESRVYAFLSDYTASSSDFDFLYTEGVSNNFSNLHNWQTAFSFYELDTSRLFLNFGYQDHVYVSLVNSVNDESAYGDLWLAKGALPNLTSSQEIEIPHNSSLISHISNYPNPFNPSTTISFSLTTEITVSTEIIIYNLKGQKVKILPISPSPSHTVSVIWDGTDDNNQPVSSGVYFYKLKAGDFEKTKKCLLMK